MASPAPTVQGAPTTVSDHVADARHHRPIPGHVGTVVVVHLLSALLEEIRGLRTDLTESPRKPRNRGR